MNAISLLCEIIEQTGRVAARSYRDDARYGALLDAGLLQRDGVVQSILCENCDAPHDAEIVFEDGAYGYCCPDLGFVSVERANLVAVRANLASLVKQLGVALGCDPGSGSQLGERTWRVGLVHTPGWRAAVYFNACLLNGDDLVELETALRAEIRRDYALVVTAAGQLQYRGAATCTLAQMVHLDLGATRIRQLVSVAETVGAPPKRTGGRPNLHRERLHALLANRAAQGIAKEGRNDEAKAVLADYSTRHPNDPAPKLSTVKAYVSDFRRG